MTSAKDWAAAWIRCCREGQLRRRLPCPRLPPPGHRRSQLISLIPTPIKLGDRSMRLPWLNSRNPFAPAVWCNRWCLGPAGNGRFQLVAGERRWLASKRAGKSTVPAVVRQISNEQAMEITIVENLQREDLKPMEQARAFERLSREFGLTQEQIAARTGKDRASIANFIRLLKLPDGLQDALESGAISFGHGKVLLGLAGFPEQLDQAAREVIEKQLSVRQTEDLVSRLLSPETMPTKAEKTAEIVDPNVREAQRTLERALGIKVEIKDRKGKGKIILKYGSLEDFDRILEALGAS